MTLNWFRRWPPCATTELKAQVQLLLVAAVCSVLILGWAAQGLGQTKRPRVGILSYGGHTDDEVKQSLKQFRDRLADHGWIEDQHVVYEYRWTPGDIAQLRAAADDLVRLKVDLIYADSAPSVRAARAATSTIPIVATDFTTDPIAEGYIESYGRPGRNITGVFLDAPEFSGKWIELLQAIVPGLSRIAVLWDPSPGPTHLRALKELARRSGLQMQIIEARKSEDLARAFSALRGRTQALIILPSPMSYLQSDQLARLTLKQRVLATSMARQFAEAGGLIVYGPEVRSLDDRAAFFVARILAGAKPGDLPVERPAKFELIVNLKTAKALGLTIPQSLLLQADEVIR